MMDSIKQNENSEKILFEQYKLYVEMTDRNSQRRSITNKFYITVLTGLLAFISWNTSCSQLCDIFEHLLLLISLLGLFLCIIWFININSYKQLNKGKFKVILEMENQLPFPCYSREWDILECGKNHRNYLPYTKIEKLIPALIAILYMFLLLYSIYNSVY